MGDTIKLIRMQDSDGRGPWKPNFSHKWISDSNQRLGPPVFEDFPNFDKIVRKAHNQGKHIGCAVRADKTKDWFLPDEIEVLRGYGYKFVDCSQCEVLAESEWQVIVASHIPFKLLPAI